jgi:hypothetical protein
MEWVVNVTPQPLYPGTLCVGGWLDPRADLNGCGKYCPERGSGAEYFRS